MSILISEVFDSIFDSGFDRVCYFFNRRLNVGTLGAHKVGKDAACAGEAVDITGIVNYVGEEEVKHTLGFIVLGIALFKSYFIVSVGYVVLCFAANKFGHICGEFFVCNTVGDNYCICHMSGAGSVVFFLFSVKLGHRNDTEFNAAYEAALDRYFSLMPALDPDETPSLSRDPSTEPEPEATTEADPEPAPEGDIEPVIEHADEPTTDPEPENTVVDVKQFYDRLKTIKDKF